MHSESHGGDEQAGLSTLPLFPLHTVLLPGAHLPLHVFEPRYRQLTIDLMSAALPDREFGVIAIRDLLTTDVDRADQLFPIGCAAILREAKQLPAGRFDIVTTGGRRFRLVEFQSGPQPYLMGTVEWLPDDPVPRGAHTLCSVARAAHQRYCANAWESGDWTEPPQDTDLGPLSYLLAADCLLTMPDRQALLAETNPVRRLQLVSKLLNREAGFVEALRAVPAPHPNIGDARAALN